MSSPLKSAFCENYLAQKVRNMCLPVLVLIGVVALLAAPARAQLAPEWNSCTGNSDIAWNLQLKSCSALINSAKESPSNRAIAYIRRALLWRSKGDPDRGLADFSEAIRLDPSPAAYFNRAMTWRHQKGDHARAVADFSHAINRDPKMTLAYFNRALSYADLKDFDRAIVDYNETIRLDPKHVLAYNNRGSAWHMKGDLDRAIADYGDVIRLSPGYSAAYYNRGLAWRAKGETALADADFDQAIKLNPNMKRP